MADPTAADLAAIAAPFDVALASLADAAAAIRLAGASSATHSVGMSYAAEDLRCVKSQVEHMRRNALRRAQGDIPPALLVAIADVSDPEPLMRRGRDPQAANTLPRPVPMPNRGAFERGRR